MTNVEEIWISIEAFEESYQISNHGRVRSISRKVPKPITKFCPSGTRHVGQKIVKLNKKSTGYLGAVLHQNNSRKYCLVHRLVAKAFIPNPENKPDVNHLNGIKTDNQVENLEWCTKHENMRHSVNLGLHDVRGEHHILSKLTDSEVRQIRNLRGKLYQKDIGELFNISQSLVNKIQTRLVWKHI